MARLAAVLGLGGLALAAAVAVSQRDRLAVAPPPGPPASERPVAAFDEPEKPAPDASNPPLIYPVRPVAPEVIAPPPIPPEMLQRIEPRSPLSEIATARPPSEGPPKETILFRPVATAGGVFTSLGHEVHLAGIVPTSADEMCISDGVSWPCGVHARTAFRNWLRGRALTCVVPPVPAGEAVTSKCLLGRYDAAAWLVSSGWVRSLPGSDYVDLEETARSERRGLFGPAPVVPLTGGISSSDGEATSAVETGSDKNAVGQRPLVSEPLPDVFGLSGG